MSGFSNLSVYQQTLAPLVFSPLSILTLTLLNSTGININPQGIPLVITLHCKCWSFGFILFFYPYFFYFCPKIISLFYLSYCNNWITFTYVLYASQRTPNPYCIFFIYAHIYYFSFNQFCQYRTYVSWLYLFRDMEPLFKPHVTLATSRSSGIKAKLIYNFYIYIYYKNYNL